MNLDDLLNSRVEMEPNSGCWLWVGTRTGNDYGALKSRNAHRVVYELLRGPLPDGVELDHRCKVRPCVNPAHMDAVSHRVNTLRSSGPTAINAQKTHCPQGHPYDKRDSNGCRRCWACQYARIRAWKEKNRGSSPAA